MCSKKTKSFRERVQQNQGKKINYQDVQEKSYVEVPINEYLIVTVERTSYVIRDNEIIEQVRDLFNFKRSYQKEEVIPLSKLSDCTFDLKYIKGTMINEIKKAYFSIC